MKILRTLAFLGTAALMLSATTAMADQVTLDFENNTSYTINGIYLSADQDEGSVQTSDSVLDYGPLIPDDSSTLTFGFTELCEVNLIVVTPDIYFPLEDYNICPEDGLISLTDYDLGVSGDEEENDCDLDQPVLVANETSYAIIELYAFTEDGEEGMSDWLSDSDLDIGGDIEIYPNDDNGQSLYIIEAYTDDGHYATTTINLCESDIAWIIHDSSLQEEGDF